MSTPISRACLALVGTISFSSLCDACSSERALPPIRNEERLIYEGTVPEGFVLDGVAVLNGTQQGRECLGTFGFIYNQIFLEEWREYHPSKTLEASVETPGPGRYRLTFPLGPDHIGGPCRWQLVSAHISAHVMNDPTPTTIYQSPDRKRDYDHQLWRGPALPPKHHTVPCLVITVGHMSETCAHDVPGDTPIPEFTGTLTVPLDVVVPGGMKAAMARLARQKALDVERQASNESLAEVAGKRAEINALPDPGANPAAQAELTAKRARLQAEIEVLEKEHAARQISLAEKAKVIRQQWEQEREPGPLPATYQLEPPAPEAAPEGEAVAPGQ